jgi:glyoxylase-like metal-dependent hydrolase (beta-lactamase superfamily II)
MQITTLLVGPIEVNCYIVFDETSGESFIIDPGADEARIEKALKEKNLSPSFIINTHGHYDHIGADTLRNLPIYIHEDDAECLVNAKRNLSYLMGNDLTVSQASKTLRDGQIIQCGNLKIEIIHTPGHTPGCICLKIDDVIFTGDTLFRGSIGRTDLPFGDSRLILQSIQKKIVPLSDSCVLYPGHGESSNLAWEKKHNFYIANRMV